MSKIRERFDSFMSLVYPNGQMPEELKPHLEAAFNAGMVEVLNLTVVCFDEDTSDEDKARAASLLGDYYGEFFDYTIELLKQHAEKN